MTHATHVTRAAEDILYIIFNYTYQLKYRLINKKWCSYLNKLYITPLSYKHIIKTKHIGLDYKYIWNNLNKNLRVIHCSGNEYIIVNCQSHYMIVKIDDYSRVIFQYNYESDEYNESVVVGNMYNEKFISLTLEFIIMVKNLILCEMIYNIDNIHNNYEIMLKKLGEEADKI
jgi:hypothetical protein